jgi:hypothetical protein
MVLGLLFASHALKAQCPPVYHLNQQVIDLEKGVALSVYQQMEAVALSFTATNVNTAYDSLVLYLARGNKPVVKQVVALEKEKSMDISSLLKQARSGDRLVMEIYPKKKKESLFTAVALK